MRALVLTKEGVVMKDVPKPKLESYLVLVKVKAASVNRADLMMAHSAAHGGWGGGAESPLGLEYAVEVVEVGADIKKWRVGDRVMGPGSGAYAEYILAFEPQLSPIPDGMSFEKAAALPVALQTMQTRSAPMASSLPARRSSSRAPPLPWASFACRWPNTWGLERLSAPPDLQSGARG